MTSTVETVPHVHCDEHRRLGFDIMVAESGSALYETYVEFFSRVREAPGLRKDILRLRL